MNLISSYPSPTEFKALASNLNKEKKTEISRVEVFRRRLSFLRFETRGNFLERTSCKNVDLVSFVLLVSVFLFKRDRSGNPFFFKL